MKKKHGISFEISTKMRENSLSIDFIQNVCMLSEDIIISESVLGRNLLRYRYCPDFTTNLPEMFQGILLWLEMGKRVTVGEQTFAPKTGGSINRD